mmetsp:Transcript_40133/g.120106  ORF Transcript_40133/g.120106 Transcript_40133/m.120106 type:complete len:332 (-) Transcript_40133:475-1470(-)
MHEFQELVLHEGHLQLIVLHLRHHPDDVHEDADKHVHDRQSDEEDEEQEEDGQKDVLRADLGHELRQVWECGLQQERVHGLGHSVEVLLAHSKTKRELPEGDRKDVGHGEHQDPGVHDRAHCHADPLDHDHQLRHHAHELCQARHAQDPQQPERPQGVDVADLTSLDVRVDHKGKDPSVDDEWKEEDQIKPEPLVLEAVPLALEGEETYAQLHHEIRGEQVVDCDENRLPGAHVRRLRRVDLSVDGNPHRVDEDDAQGKVLETLAPGDPLRPPIVGVEVSDIVRWLHDRPPDFVLHDREVDEAGAPDLVPVLDLGCLAFEPLSRALAHSVE